MNDRPRRPYGLGTVEPYRGQLRARGPRDATGKRPVLGIFPIDQEGAAEKLLEDVAILKAEAHLGGKGSMTLTTYGSRFLDARDSAGVRDIKNERSRWRHHCATAHFKDWPMQNVEKTDAKEWLAGLGQKEAVDNRVADPKLRAERVYRRKVRKLSAQTRKHCLNLMRMAWDQAIEDGHATINPFATLEAPQIPKPSFDYLHLADQKQFERCEAIDEVDRLRVMFAYGSGLRQNDQWVMKIADLRLDLDAPDMMPLVHKRGPRKPPERMRIDLFGVALYAAKRMLKLLPAYCPDNPKGLLWPLPSGAQRQKRKPYGWNELRAKAGIKRHITWHELRDTCASSLLMGWWGRKWSLSEVAAQLCQSDIETTVRYAHMAPSALAQAARETIGHQLASTPRRGTAKSRAKSRRATQESNLRPTAPEAVALSN